MLFFPIIFRDSLLSRKKGMKCSKCGKEIDPIRVKALYDPPLTWPLCLPCKSKDDDGPQYADEGIKGTGDDRDGPNCAAVRKPRDDDDGPQYDAVRK